MSLRVLERSLSLSSVILTLILLGVLIDSHLGRAEPLPEDTSSLKMPPDLVDVSDHDPMPTDQPAPTHLNPTFDQVRAAEPPLKSKEKGGEQANVEGPSIRGSSLTFTEVKVAFDRGRNAYLYGSYEEAVKYLTPLIRPKVLIADPQSLSLTYEYLGLAHFYLENELDAVQTFKDLIYFRPEHQLDPVRVPPNAVSLYNQIHDELQAELLIRQEAITRQAELEEEKRLRKLRQSVILEQQVNQRLVAFLPFGAGQFQNRESGLGYFFLGSELVAVGLSAGFFWGVESLRQSDGRFTSQDYLFAQELQRAQIVSGGIALGLIVGGIIQALWRYKDRHDLGNYLDLNEEDKDESLQEGDLVEPLPSDDDGDYENEPVTTQ
jgi:hypothetical protein